MPVLMLIACAGWSSQPSVMLSYFIFLLFCELLKLKNINSYAKYKDTILPSNIRTSLNFSVPQSWFCLSFNRNEFFIFYVWFVNKNVVNNTILVSVFDMLFVRTFLEESRWLMPLSKYIFNTKIGLNESAANPNRQK